jgi:hypothetical protein
VLNKQKHALVPAEEEDVETDVYPLDGQDSLEFEGTLESWWCRRLVSNGTASMTKSDASDGSFLQILAAVDNATL